MSGSTFRIPNSIQRLDQNRYRSAPIRMVFAGPRGTGVLVQTFLAPAPAAGDAAAEPERGESGEKRKSGRLVVFGDSDFAANAQLSSVGNPTLLLNTINWLVERENLLAIPPRKAEQIQLNLSRSQLSSVYLLVLLVLPLASMAVGVGVYLRRRR